MNGQSTIPAMPLPADLPWGQTVGLLLDALQVKDLIRRLYEWSPSPEVSVLYNGTQWAQISQLSPCLVRLRDCNDPALLQFLANASSGWGYLLISDGSWDDLVAHLRWLTSIRPALYDEMYLRISQPDVAHALFAPEHHPCAELFGPCQMIIAHYPMQGWRQYSRQGDRPAALYREPYTPNDSQWAALKAIAYRKSVNQLYQHMRRFFPEYRADLSAEQRLERVDQLVASAIDSGFRTRQEIWLYANVFGFLGDEGLKEHPDIVELLSKESSLTPYQRVDRAATLAAERSAQ